MTPEEFKKRCKGIVPVQYCPFTEKGELRKVLEETGII